MNSTLIILVGIIFPLFVVLKKDIKNRQMKKQVGEEMEDFLVKETTTEWLAGLAMFGSAVLLHAQSMFWYEGMILGTLTLFTGVVLTGLKGMQDMKHARLQDVFTMKDMRLLLNRIEQGETALHQDEMDDLLMTVLDAESLNEALFIKMGLVNLQNMEAELVEEDDVLKEELIQELLYNWNSFRQKQRNTVVEVTSLKSSK